MNSLIQFFSLTAAYFITAQLGQLIVVPPGYASAAWPAAGVALVGLLVFGYRFWPSITAASFLVNIQSFDLINLNSVPALTMAVGATLQALLGAYLIRCFIKSSLTLEKEEDILKFLFLGGPISSLLGAFFGVITLIFIVKTRSDVAFQAGWMWWVGNTAGVLIFAPIMMAFVAEPKEVWRSRRMAVAIPLIILFSLIVFIFYLVKNDQKQHIRQEFKSQSEEIGNKIKSHMSNYFEELYSLRNYYNTVTLVERSDFTDVTKKLLNHKSMIGLQWCPRVGPSERQAFEESIQKEGHGGFVIKSLDDQNRTQISPIRDVYFPVTYVEPFEKNSMVLGVDLMSDKATSSALSNSWETGELVLTKPIRLMQGPIGAIAFLPVYSTDQSVLLNANKTLKGVVSLVTNIENLVSRDLEIFRNKIGVVHVADIDPTDGRINIFSLGSEENNKDSDLLRRIDRFDRAFYSEHTITIGARNWSLMVYPRTDYFRIHEDITKCIFLVAALLFLGFLGVFLLIISGRRTLISRIVSERVEVLNKSNEQLRSGLEFSAKISEDLIRSKEELLKMSLTDPLTGLLNRRGFEIYVEENIKFAKQNNLKKYLLYIDVDNMKTVNDVLGHKDGDSLLIEVARLLKNCFRETDILARLGGDEFSVLLTVSNVGDENFVIKRLQMQIENINTISTSRKYPLSLSIGGVSCDLQEPFDLKVLLAQADQMMYIQKRSKKTT